MFSGCFFFFLSTVCISLWHCSPLSIDFFFIDIKGMKLGVLYLSECSSLLTVNVRTHAYLCSIMLLLQEGFAEVHFNIATTFCELPNLEFELAYIRTVFCNGLVYFVSCWKWKHALQPGPFCECWWAESIAVLVSTPQVSWGYESYCILMIQG